MTHTSAKVICDTVHPKVPTARITTFEVYAPRFLLAELNTHRVLAKSVASSRAIPVRKRIEMVEKHGFIPSVFGKNRSGMQSSEALAEQEGAADLWKMAIGYAVGVAEAMEKLGVHKQHANRVLEPFAYFHAVITATEWSNFFNLRLHPDAQPEFQELARVMKDAMDVSVPRKDTRHLPYIDGGGEDLRRLFNRPDLFKISSARCARVSYKTHDGKPFDFNADLDLCADLIKGGHLSPFDHPAEVDDVILDGSLWEAPHAHRQFWGWIPHRVRVELDNHMLPGRRDSYGLINKG